MEDYQINLAFTRGESYINMIILKAQPYYKKNSLPESLQKFYEIILRY
tara:strand:+ start:1228 stop:1371 length:144 start_codon:yes stop_codon:yes gene_type:complete